MNDRQMRYFIAVAEEFSFSRAAKRLNVSQPPLSMQIKALEDELGTPLLERTRRRVSLTESGRLFLEHARAAIRQMDHAREVVRCSINGEAGRLRIGFTGSVPMLDIFARVLRLFRKTYPAVEIVLHHMNTAQQLKAIQIEEIDVGIMRPALNTSMPSALHFEELWQDRLVAFLPEDHRLAGSRSPVTMGELADEHFIIVKGEAGCGVRAQTLALCSAAGFSPSIAQECGELSPVLGLVSAGVGIAVLPDCYCRIGLPAVVSREIEAAGTESRFLIGSLANPKTRAASHFREVALRVISERNAVQTVAPFPGKARKAIPKVPAA
jgi:DNA-binding transcriptional LysR family regulator